jgi:hypothetical protein
MARAQSAPAAQGIANGENIIIQSGHIEKGHQSVSRRLSAHNQAAGQGSGIEGEKVREWGQVTQQSRHCLIVGIYQGAVQVKQDSLDLLERVLP